MAESRRRTPDRLDPQGLPGPFHHLQRAASETNPEFIFHLLPRIEDSFRTRQAMSACSAGLECRNDRPDSAPWRLASPLRTHGSVMLCLRTHFCPTTSSGFLTIRGGWWVWLAWIVPPRPEWADCVSALLRPKRFL